MDSGRVPRTIECEVTNDLVDRVIPGDVVEITGIVKVAQSEKSKDRRVRFRSIVRCVDTMISGLTFDPHLAY